MKRTIVWCCITAVPLFVVAFYLNGFITEYLLSFFDGSPLIFQQTTVSNFSRMVLLSLAIALVPVFILVTWQLAGIHSVVKKVLSAWLVLIVISGAITLNVFRVLSTKIVVTNLKGKISYPLEELYFEYAILSGTVIGCGIALWIFKNKKSNDI